MGIAGGQATVGAPQIRPRASAAGTVSWGASRACPDGACPLPPGLGQHFQPAVGLRILPQRRRQTAEVLRRIFRRGHQHHEIPVGVLALHAVQAQAVRQSGPGGSCPERRRSAAEGPWSGPASRRRSAGPGSCSAPRRSGTAAPGIPPPDSGYRGPERPTSGRRGWWSRRGPWPPLRSPGSPPGRLCRCGGTPLR